jgi:hypothetical protein
MNTKVLAMFDKLLDGMLSEKIRLAEAMKEATLGAQFTKAQQLLARAERVERLMEQVQQLRDAWEQLDKPEDSLAGGTEDPPELDLIERLFSARHHGGTVKRQKADKTPEREYRVPILESLEQLGGQGHVKEVLRLVYEKMKNRLTGDDLKPLPSGGEVRWANTAMWARFNMVREGLLRSDSPRGVWEISEMGRAYLEQARQRGEEMDKS